jgi:glycosyltransferase involved in cell wall biosynthesis/SAM-dependent methyltransferase
MRVALVSPLPPAKSGIADYSAALLQPLKARVEVEIFSEQPARFEPSRYDAIFYQVGNNGWHTGAYEMALQHPGIVVMHEANLHHLITDITIRRDRWDLYVAEAEWNGGADALAHALRAQALEVGPDYDGLPMTRRLLERARAVIVHSHFTAGELRRQGYQGPLAVIPHGAWIPEANRLTERHKLGLTERDPLIGVFGFLKPYKRIAESLRAFKRLLRVEPRAKLVLVGEPHRELALDSLISGMGLSGSVRVLGFVPESEFVDIIAACDIVLNLRYPTVGESSGTLLRALGLGRAVLVSDLGSFAEFPDDVCLKVPVDAREEDTIFEHLNLLCARPRLARTLGENARAWVERECNWERVAGLYLDFASAVREGRAWPEQPVPAPLPAPAPASAPVEAEYVLGWASDEPARQYVEQHQTRLLRTLEITPPGTAAQRILEMGSYLQITPALKLKLGYGEVRGCYYGPQGRIDHREVRSADGEDFAVEIDHFDAEIDVFPYPDAHFDTVLCGELIEHLRSDPMHLMAEANRILKPGGHLVLTTPNIVSTRALAAILQGYHPGFFPAYIRPAKDGEETDARHAREYTPKEIHLLYYYAGFEVVRLETGEFHDEPQPAHHWVRDLLERYGLPEEWRGDGIYAVGRKVAVVRERYPAWLYSGGD